MICFRHEEKVCREESECSYEGICDGTSARCLQSSSKPDSIPCENDSKASIYIFNFEVYDLYFQLSLAELYFLSSPHAKRDLILLSKAILLAFSITICLISFG